MNGCIKCGKELQIGDRVVWRCEDCARKQMEEYDNKDQQIAELEEKLKNAIVPKFKYCQNVWCVYPTNEYREGFVFELDFVGYTKDKIICKITENEEFNYDEVFATKEEAQAKLKELQSNDN